MAVERKNPNIGASEWVETRLGKDSRADEKRTHEEPAHNDRAFECTKCGLVVGGAPITRRPERCPVCIAREGKAVAIVAAEDAARLSMLVLDRKLLELIENYRRAKRDHERQLARQAVIDQLGNYDLDAPLSSSEIDLSASREQQAALALADATIDRGRTSRTSVH